MSFLLIASHHNRTISLHKDVPFLAPWLGFSWNFFFGSDYMGKTFIVQRDPQQGYINREAFTTSEGQTEMKEERKNKNNVKLGKYIRIAYR